MVIDTVLLLMFFVAWCVLDYRLVQSPEYPNNIHSDDWTFALVPIATLACNLWATRELSRSRRVLYSMLGSLLMCIAFVLFVLVFGIPFHFQIGGHQ